MSTDSLERLQSIFRDTIASHERFAAERLDVLVAASDAICRCLEGGGKVIAFGNGGSASDAQHLVSELVGRFEMERRSWPGIALTADSNIVTAIGNDYGYEALFTRQLEGLGRPGDVAFGISTSGRSPNVVAGLKAARAAGIVTIALTGRDGGPIGAAAEIHINVADQSTPRVQEVQRTILHAICSLVEGRLAGQG